MSNEVTAGATPTTKPAPRAGALIAAPLRVTVVPNADEIPVVPAGARVTARREASTSG
jgi:hypothetical protein